MGQTLSSPEIKKTTESGSNERFLYGLSEMQGWRITMEDAHAAILDLDGPDETPNSFFAVYDGHGGSTVAKFAGQNVHKRLVTEESYKQKDYAAALKKAFLGTDEDLLANPAHTRDPSGCTAVAALVTSDNKIYVANAGDSRTVLGSKGIVKPLSFDHKPTSSTERERIEAAGGYIEYGRVNGNLALSRALGDFEFKKNYSVTPEAQIITANPDITVHDLEEDDEFLVLACDGIWDCLSSQQVVDFVRYQVSEGKDLTEIGELMCDHCLAPDTTSGAGIGCDNMTVLIVAITHGRTKEQWYQWITDRVKSGYGYNTPHDLPQLYSQSRLLSFRARKEAQEARQRLDAQNHSGYNFGEPASTFDGESFLRRFGLTVTNISGGGISYRPGGSAMSDSGQLMFTGEDSDSDEDSDEEMSTEMGSSRFLNALGESGMDEDSESGDAPAEDAATKSLKKQLDDYAKEVGVKDEEMSVDGDAVEAITSPATSAKLTHSDAATTPTPTSASESETTGTTPELKPTPEPIAA